MSKWSRVGGVLLIGFGLLLTACWLVGATGWGDGPRRWMTDVDRVQGDLAQVIGDRPVRVAVVGDVQNGLSEFTDLLQRTAKQEPDVVLQLGDTVNKAAPGRYALLHSLLDDAALAAPWLGVPGNHDMRRENGALDLYETWMGPLHWRLDVGGWRILGLDNAAGPLSAPSLVLLADAAKSPPASGLIVLAHRPIEEPLTPRPALQLAGHVHRTDDFVDARGTRHIHHGNNCDRSHDSRPEDLPTVGVLTLTADGFGWEGYTVPRSWKVDVEFRRLALGSVYPWIRSSPLLAGAALSVLLALGVWLLRRAPEPSAGDE